MKFLNRQLPGRLDTSLNRVHVRDVAIGAIPGGRESRADERYIFGHADTISWLQAHE